MPPQPHFETYLKSKGLTLQPYTSAFTTKEDKIIGGGEFEKKRATTPTALAKKNSFTNVDTNNYSTASTSPYDSKMKDNINMLRMSQNILKNQIKELNQYENKENKEILNNDIKLLNKDQELNFGDKDDEEEEEDGSDNGNDNQEETTGEDEHQHTDVGIVTKINFAKKNDTKSPRAATPSNKGVHSVKTNNRNLKAEADVTLHSVLFM